MRNRFHVFPLVDDRGPIPGRKKTPERRHMVASGAEKKMRDVGRLTAYVIVSVTGILPFVAWE